jgi:hypothetical protein
MLPPSDERGLRALLLAGGLVATAAGFHSALTGGRSIPPWRTLAPEVESELRYYGVFYAAFGLNLIDVARSPKLEGRRIDVSSAVVLAGGLARASAWRQAGPPHPLQRVLLGIEVGAPVVVSIWRSATGNTRPRWAKRPAA